MDKSIQKLKETWQSLSEKSRKIIKAIVVATAVIALIAIVALSLGRDTEYSVLFTGLNQEEAQKYFGLYNTRKNHHSN